MKETNLRFAPRLDPKKPTVDAERNDDSRGFPLATALQTRLPVVVVASRTGVDPYG